MSYRGSQNQGLVHGRLDAANQVGTVFKLGAVGNRLHMDPAGMPESETDPVAGQAVGQLSRRSRCCCLESLVLETGNHDVENHRQASRLR